MKHKERADKLLADRGLAETRQKGQALIMAGLVKTAAGRKIDKAGEQVDVAETLVVERPLPYVGRGGLKLAEALDAFGVDAAGKVCLDIGSSTGGFTDCLLQRGAARVYAVDVDIRQLDARLRRDPRVVTIEKNARALASEDLPETPMLVVMDVSFISIAKILPAIRKILGAAADDKYDKYDKYGDTSLNSGDKSCVPVLSESPPIPIRRLPVFSRAASQDQADDQDEEQPEPGGEYGDISPNSGDKSCVPVFHPAIVLALIKPQFEAGRGQVGKKGIVRDPVLHAAVLTRIVREAAALGFRLRGLHRPATRGQKGNQEFFARFALDGLHPPEAEVLQWIARVTSDKAGETHAHS